MPGPGASPATRALGFPRLLGTNAYWFGLATGAGILTPLLLPSLVSDFVPLSQQNTYLANLRVAGLAVAMFIQPAAGLLSDRSRSRFGRRSPFVLGGALFSSLFLLIFGVSPAVQSRVDGWWLPAGYVTLLVGLLLLQVSSNTSQAALQGLMPDLVPEWQRGRASGIKSMLELLPVLVVIAVAPLVDRDKIWLVLAVTAAAYLLSAAITVLAARETPLLYSAREPVWEAMLRFLAVTGLFVAVSQAALGLSRQLGWLASASSVSFPLQVFVVGIAGLLAMAAAVLIGVYGGALLAIGPEARRHTSFIWWVVNRLLFLAAIGSIQGFTLYYLRDVIRLQRPAAMTSVLLGAVALFLLPSALGAGLLADRGMSRRGLVAAAGLVAAVGAGVLLFARGLPLAIVAGCILGAGTGAFYAANWALGTLLAPPAKAGMYLGVSNLAGAGAGIIGAGIGGPIADIINARQTGLGYSVIVAIYAGLFLLSVLALARVREPSLPVS